MTSISTTVPTGPWKVCVHTFGGGYCVSRRTANGREHLLSKIGAAPQIASFPTREAAQAAIPA